MYICSGMPRRFWLGKDTGLEERRSRHPQTAIYPRSLRRNLRREEISPRRSFRVSAGDYSTERGAALSRRQRRRGALGVRDDPGDPPENGPCSVAWAFHPSRRSGKRTSPIERCCDSDWSDCSAVCAEEEKPVQTCVAGLSGLKLLTL